MGLSCSISPLTFSSPLFLRWNSVTWVLSVVLCEFVQRFFNSCFHLYERGLLSCDTHIICVYEASCSVVERLVVSVDVEKDGGQDTSTYNLLLDSMFWITLHSGRS